MVPWYSRYFESTQTFTMTRTTRNIQKAYRATKSIHSRKINKRGSVYVMDDNAALSVTLRTAPTMKWRDYNRGIDFG